MSAYRSPFVETPETLSFRLRLKNRLGNEGLGSLCMAGLVLLLGSPFLFMIFSLTMPDHMREFYFAHIPFLVTGIALGVSSRVIDLGWRGYWNEY